MDTTGFGVPKVRSGDSAGVFTHIIDSSPKTNRINVSGDRDIEICLDVLPVRIQISTLVRRLPSIAIRTKKTQEPALDGRRQH